MSWKRMDLHLHTPASSDYRDPGITYLDILKKAEEKKLDMIAFADHNTVTGYAALRRELEILGELERRNRLDDTERQTLTEYRRLLSKIVVLPAFEFTATFGFHILGIFPENTSIRKLEYLLLDLNVPEEKMLAGAPDVGSTSDVLRAYAAITAAGGMAVAAHANSSNGVAMQGFPFGGQTKIAYTQDTNLMALEVTDMEVSGRRMTASFFNGTKTEYPRRMHIIQGSDAHSLDTEQLDSANKRLGVGARVTEILVKEASFAALKEIFTSNDFTRIRPARSVSAWEDIEQARTEGPSLNRSFHERASTKTSRTRPVLHDIVAFANTEGGCIYVGVSPEPRLPVHGVDHPDEAVKMLKGDIERSVEPPISLDYEVRMSGDRAVIIVNVPAGDETPYVYTPTGQVYVRQGAETEIATRQEIVNLVLRSDALEAMEAEEEDDQEARVTPAAITEPIAAHQRERERGRERERRAETPAASLPPAVPAPAQRETGSRAGQGDEGRTAWPERLPSERIQGQGQRSPVQPQAQQPAAPQQPAQETPARAPVFHNLPPEKIKGRVQPMAPRGGTPADTAWLSPAEPAEMASRNEQVTSPLRMGQLERYVGETVRLGGHDTDEAPAAVGAAPGAPDALPDSLVPAVDEPALEALERSEVAEETQQVRRSSRRRGKAATSAAELPAEAPELPPMEATVASEHKTREELVAEEKPKRSRRGRSRAEMARLEVEEPAASAAATEPGIEAVIEETREEAQAMSEHVAEAAQPATKGRSRRRKGAQAEAAQPEAPAPEAPPPPAPAEAAQAAEPQAAAEGKKPRRGRKKATPEEAPAQAAALPASTETPAQPGGSEALPVQPPTMGAEIVDMEMRNGTRYYTVRNMQEGYTVHNVTRKSARRLWHYAIVQQEHGDPAVSEVLWHQYLPIGLWRRGQRAGAERYDLVMRLPSGKLCVYYGVTEDGMHGPWQELIDQADQVGYFGPDPAE